MDKSYLDIFICSHKPFQQRVKNDCYRILSVGGSTLLNGENILKDDVNINCMNVSHFYSELSGYYWIWKNYQVKEYIGFCHYRRYFDFFDNIPNMDKEAYDIILPTPSYFFMGVYNQYKQCHNVDDINSIIDILRDDFNVPQEIINSEIINSTKAYCYNMFITKRELFYDYCEFIFGVLETYLQKHNFNNMNDIYSHISLNKEKYLKGKYPSNDIKYQCRIGGFLSERLMGVWVKLRNLRVKEVDVIETEVKYKEKRNNDFV